MIISTQSLLRIDRLFRWSHRFVAAILQARQVAAHPSDRLKRSSRSDQPSGQVLVLKLMGLGSIIKFAGLCDENGVEKSKITLVTFYRHRELGTLFGIRKNVLIRTDRIFYFVQDCWKLFLGVKYMSLSLIIDFERCSHAVGLYSTLLAWRGNCKIISFEKRSRHLFSAKADIFSIDLLSYEGLFLKGIDYISKSTPKLQTKTIQINSRKVLVNINASEYLLARRYDKNSFREVIRLVHQSTPDLEFHFTGSQGEFDYIEELVRELLESGIKAINQSCAWGLTNLVKELADCVVFITGDSGPLHLAAYMRVPTLAIWGPTQAVHFGYDKRDWIYNASMVLPCSPCFRDPTSRPALVCSGRIDCMKFAPSVLAEAALGMISQSRSSREVVMPPGMTVGTSTLAASG